VAAESNAVREHVRKMLARLVERFAEKRDGASVKRAEVKRK
jgi:hypothetical protein